MTYDCQSDADRPVTDLIKAAITASSQRAGNSEAHALRVSIMRYLAVFPNPFKDEDGKFPVRPNHISRGRLPDAALAAASLRVAEDAVRVLDGGAAAVLEVHRSILLPIENGLARDLAETIRRERATALADMGVRPYDEA